MSNEEKPHPRGAVGRTEKKNRAGKEELGEAEPSDHTQMRVQVCLPSTDLGREMEGKARI